MSERAAPSGLTLYVTSWCPYCRKARQYLNKKGIRYTELDVETPRGKEAYRAAGGNGVPLMVSGSRRVDGFSEEAYDQFFAGR